MMNFATSFKTVLAAGVVGVLALAASSASAATLSITGDITFENLGGGGKEYTYDPAIERAELECTLGCEGLKINLAEFSQTLSGGSFLSNPDIDDADGFGVGFAELFIGEPKDELSYINSIVGDGTYASGVKTEEGGDFYEWTTNAEYILLKIGLDPNMTIIKNTGGYGNVFTYRQSDGGQGLSHFTSYGEYECPTGDPRCGGGVLPPVPLPAGMPMLLGAFGLLAVVRRKFSKAA
jgi:hypothetical protein